MVHWMDHWVQGTSCYWGSREGSVKENQISDIDSHIKKQISSI